MSDGVTRVTIRDVAADAQLSISTVSRALTGARAVTPAIAARVRDSATRLGYRADSIGRSLRTQRTDTLGLVIPDITNPFFPELVQAIEHAARERGLGVLIADSANDPAAEREAMRTLVDRRVDALLVSPTHITESRDALAETATRVPTIQIDRVIDPDLPFVRANQSLPVETIVRHLRTTGRRHIAFIGQETSSSTSRERESAFRQLMSVHFSAEPLRVVNGGMSAESGRAALRQLTTRWPEADAIVCASDLIAVGVLQELGTHPGTHPGRREVAVSGFDDTLLSRAMRITSVRQPVDGIADAALTAATAQVELPLELAVELHSEVIFRFSTA
jgi:LacI family transcriptional regulator